MLIEERCRAGLYNSKLSSDSRRNISKVNLDLILYEYLVTHERFVPNSKKEKHVLFVREKYLRNLNAVH